MNELLDVQDRSVRIFSSGAIRDSNEGKSRPDLITPYFLKRFGYHLAKGAVKYGEYNWQKGMDDKVFKESMMRHVISVMEDDFSEDHWSAIAFALQGLMENQKRAGLKDDYFK